MFLPDFIVDKLSLEANLTKEQASEVIGIFLDFIVENIKAKGRVLIESFFELFIGQKGYLIIRAQKPFKDEMASGFREKMGLFK